MKAKKRNIIFSIIGCVCCLASLYLSESTTKLVVSLIFLFSSGVVTFCLYKFYTIDKKTKKARLKELHNMEHLALKYPDRYILVYNEFYNDNKWRLKK